MSIYFPTSGFIPTLFQGDVTIEPGLDVEFGQGDLNVTRNVVVNGSMKSLNASTGSLYLPFGGLSISTSTNALNVSHGGAVTIAGGMSVARDTFLGQKLDVQGHTTLDQTTIDTTDGEFLVNGPNRFAILVDNSSEIYVSQGIFSVTTGNDTLKLESKKSGASDALTLKATTPGSGIFMETHSGGYRVDTKFNGPISLNSNFGASNFTVFTNNENQNLNIGIIGLTNSSLILSTESVGVFGDTDYISQAIEIKTKSNNGNILIANATNSNSNVAIKTGNGGLKIDTRGILANSGSGGILINSTSGNVSLTTNNGITTITNNSQQSNQDLSLILTGNTSSKINIQSSNNINTLSSKTTFIGSSSTKESEGIRIGTLNSEQVTLGTLDVQEKFPVVNSIASNADSHGGLVVKRYQTVSSDPVTFGGDVVGGGADPYLSGGVLSGSLSSITSNVTVSSKLVGMWIKLINNLTGAVQVRRIKGVSGNVISIFSTLDHTNDPKTPREGLDFTSLPQSGWLFEIYSCNYPMTFWNETEKQWSFACSPTQNPSNFSNSDLSLLNIKAGGIFVNTINNSVADSAFTIVLSDLENGFVYLPLPDDVGIYTIMVRPTTDKTKPYASFMIGRGSQSLVGSVTRVVSVKGINRSQLDLTWIETQDDSQTKYPKLIYKPAPGTATETEYTVKIITA